MPHHYTKDIEETFYWCKTCGRTTVHRVNNCRLQHCLEHGPKVNERGENKKQQQQREQRERDQQNPKLF